MAMTETRSSPHRLPLPPRDPKGGRPRQEIADLLCGHILEVALAQFITHGAEGASMDLIAAAANVSKRTLYARFGSKIRLLVAAMEHGICNYLKPIVANMHQGSTRDRLKSLAQEMLDLSLKPEVIGLEQLVIWIRDRDIKDIDLGQFTGNHPGIQLSQTLLEEAQGIQGARQTHDPSSEDLSFLAAFAFDILVTVPRQRILFRRDLPDTAEAKNAYLEQTLDLLAEILPPLRR